MIAVAEGQHVLIDTDIGDDVDDAFALALATRLPSLRLCGVTTVAGPVIKRARLAQTVLQAAGATNVPVAAGSSSTLRGRAGSERCSHCSAALLDLGANTNPAPDADATNLILHCSQAAPLTLITLGPLTNIALALQRDPTLAQRARLVAMGGKLGVPYPDWNIRCDPEAVRIVLASGMPIRFVGMHLTMRCKLQPEQMQRLLAGSTPLARLLARCVMLWRTWHRRMPILHDPLTVAVAAEPELVALHKRRVSIIGGLLTTSRYGQPNASICTNLDLAQFHTMLDRYLLGDDIQPNQAPTFAQRLIRRFV